MKTFFKNFAFILGVLSTSCFGMEYKAQDFFSGKLDSNQLKKLAQEKEKEIIAIINSPEFDVNQKITLYEHNYSTFIIAQHYGTTRILEALLKKAKPSDIDPFAMSHAFLLRNTTAFLMFLKYKGNPLEMLKSNCSSRHPIYAVLWTQIISRKAFDELKICMDTIMQVCPEFLITPDSSDKMDCWQAAQKARQMVLNDKIGDYKSQLYYIDIFIEYLKEQYAKYKYTLKD